MIKSFSLNDGSQIPALGLGTHRIDESGTDMCTAINRALQAGYRMFDTAAGYKNEDRLGNAIALAPIRRQNLYIITKLDDLDHTKELTKLAIERSLERLKTDYIDLFLIHSPNSDNVRTLAEEYGYEDIENAWAEMNSEVWQVMEEYHNLGVLKSIGVSNFQVHHLQRLLLTAKIIPSVNQVKTCPGSLSANKSLELFCKEHQIRLMGYSPFGHGFALDIPTILSIANRHNKSTTQIILRYLYECGIVSLSRSSNLSHMKQNVEIFDFSLSANEHRLLESIKLEEKWAMIRNPDTGLKYN